MGIYITKKDKRTSGEGKCHATTELEGRARSMLFLSLNFHMIGESETKPYSRMQYVSVCVYIYIYIYKQKGNK